MTVTVPSLEEPVVPAAAPARTDPAWPSAGQAYYMVLISALVVMFAEIDRSIMSLLVQPIEKDLHIQDAQMGVLLGLAFGLFYAICGIPVSRFIDRNNRKNILSIALALWSIATLFCGLAQNFIQLATARLFLGAAESVNGPAVFSMISDSFPKERLPRAIAVMQLGPLGGNVFALIMGAIVIKLLMGMPDLHIAGVGVIRWWQMVFIIIGLPGILVALLQAVTVKEPVRRGVPAAGIEKVGLMQVLRYMAAHRKVFGPQFGAMAISALAMGTLTWGAAFYQRTYGWSPVQVGLTLGVVQLIATPIGLFLGVVVVEHLAKRHVDAPMKLICWGRLIALPASIAMPLMPTPELALAMSAISGIMLGATGSSTNAVLQIVTPNQMRGQMTAMFLFLFTVVGNAISPTLVGLVTQYVFHDPSQLRYAMLSVTLLFMPLSLLVFWQGAKPYRRELTRLGLAPAE